MKRNQRESNTNVPRSFHPPYPTVVAILALTCLLTSNVAAGLLTTINPGGAVNPVGALVPVGGGTVVAQTQSAFSSPTGAFKATLTSIVLAGDAANPYGGLDFIYILENDAISIDSLDRLTVNNFAGFLTDVGYETPFALASVLPTKITRSSNAVNGGAVIGFRYDPGGNGVIDPGKTTVTMIVQTNAPQWKDTYASVINSERADLPSYGPAVPEPSSLALAGLGIAGLIAFAGRRR